MQGRIKILNAHCEGEVGKVAIGGEFGVKGETLADKLTYINTVDDSLRRTLTLEPRSAPAGSTNLIFAASDPNADVGFIVLQPDQAHAMSGSNSICVVTALLESGHMEMHEPETVVTLETAAGLVKTTAHCGDGKCHSVSLDMTPSFVEALDLPLHTDDWGEIKFDLCFGGIFYALIDVRQIGLKIEPGQADALARAGMTIKSLIAESVDVRHPEIPEIHGVAYVMFRDGEDDGAVRTCTTLWPGRLDRSPCGTGSSAHLATMYARGEIKVGEKLITRSTIGSEFTVKLTGVTSVAGREAVLPRITGRAWLYGSQELFVDPDDPFPTGFALSDAWGPMAGLISKQN